MSESMFCDPKHIAIMLAAAAVGGGAGFYAKQKTGALVGAVGAAALAHLLYPVQCPTAAKAPAPSVKAAPSASTKATLVAPKPAPAPAFSLSKATAALSKAAAQIGVAVAPARIVTSPLGVKTCADPVNYIYVPAQGKCVQNVR